MTTIGCYGSVICNKAESEICQKCSLAIACFELVKENTEKIKARHEVDTSVLERRNYQRDVMAGKITNVIPHSGKRETLTDYQKSIVENEAFPVKARKLVASLFRKGITGGYLRTLMKAGVNPFANSTPVILDVTCRLIMRGKLSRANLRSAFISLGQSDKTALAQANVVVHGFLMMGVLTIDLKLRGG